MNQNMKGQSSISVVTSGTQRASTDNRLNEMHNPNSGIMMNNFAGPSDTQNFAEN